MLRIDRVCFNVPDKGRRIEGKSMGTAYPWRDAGLSRIKEGKGR